MGQRLFNDQKRNLIGMIHLPPLPGAPDYAGSMSAIVDSALSDARTLVAAGFDGLMVENFNDAPFFKDCIPAETVAGLTRCSHELRAAFPLIPIGVNALMNDATSALGIAEVTDCDFIRVNILCGAAVTDQGLIEGQAAQLARLKSRLSSDVSIWADLNVKHAQPLVAYNEDQFLADLVHRGKANVVILSGSGTGQPTDPDAVNRVQSKTRAAVAVGSGIDAENLALYNADYLIVGTSLKIGNAINIDKARELVARRNNCAFDNI